MAHSPDLLLLFTPHVPERITTTGWTPDRQRCFIAALARMGVVSAAAKSVGMTARSAYSLRHRVRMKYGNWADTPMRPETAAALGPGYIFSFAAAWDLALGEGLELQIDAALPVALEGEEVPVIRRGRIIGWQKKFNARLAIAALGAFRRSYEGSWYDHEVRAMRSTERYASKIEALMRLGPIDWPEPKPPETREYRLARLRKQRLEERIYGKRDRNGLLDPYGPADRPPRTLKERGLPDPAAIRREERIYGKRVDGMLDPYGPADRPPRTLAERAAEAAEKARAK